MKSGRSSLHARAARRALIALLAVLPAAAPAADAQKKRASDLGRKVFTEIAQPSCTICHALKDAGSTGAIGPALDDLKPDAARTITAVRNGVGVMPAYGDKLSEDEMKALAQYISRVTGAAK